MPHKSETALLQRVARSAVRALYAEVALEPKPGLVSFRDNGSHSDMQAATFFKSLFALRHYFGHMARAGACGHPLEFLQALGLGAEERMLMATGGINTHRGAVFALGLLCAAAGRLMAQGAARFGAGAEMPGQALLAPQDVRASLLSYWGVELRLRADASLRAVPVSNGQRAVRRYGLRSAGEEAALGFPTLFEVTLPTLQAALQNGHAQRAARVQALFATMAVLDDTNTAHRGGMEGVQCVKGAARSFLDAGGVEQGDWVERARAVHGVLVQQRLSPGGAADVLACACWLQELGQGEPTAHSGAAPATAWARAQPYAPSQAVTAAPALPGLPVSA
jgi:triphosphoribosyl-dephospho-CoA synthase